MVLATDELVITGEAKDKSPRLELAGAIAVDA
jgi:hypothetical protein